MNILHEFTIPKEVERLIEEETPEGILTKKGVDTILVPVAVKKPTRRELETIERKYSVYLSECIKEGIVTRPMLAKTYANMGGTLSNEEQERYTTMYNRLKEKQFEIEQTNLVNRLAMTSDEREEFNEKCAKLMADFWAINSELTEFEHEQAELFSQTAENIAKDKTLLWATVNMTYLKNIDEKGELSQDWKELFVGRDYEEKLDYYDDFLEGEDMFLKRAAQHATLVVGFWYTGRAKTKEDFDYIETILKNINEKNEMGELDGIYNDTYEEKLSENDSENDSEEGGDDLDDLDDLDGEEETEEKSKGETKTASPDETVSEKE